MVFDAYRSLRAQIEASILPLATSVDGRRFSFQAPIEGLELRLGGSGPRIAALLVPILIVPIVGPLL